MVILSENNSFQNIQRCLNKKCNAVHQVEDFLQFCIQIIFYDKINIAGIVPLYVIQNSNAIIEELSSNYEIDVFNVTTIDDNGENAVKLTNNVSNILSLHIDDILKDCKRLNKTDSVNLFPSLNQSSVALTNKATIAIKNKDIQFLTIDAVQFSSFSQDSGFFKVVNNEAEILNKILNFATTNIWNDAMTFHLMSKIKYLLNKNLAILNQQIYAPSVIRGREEVKNKIILSNIDTIFKNSKNIMGIADTKKYVGNIKMSSLMYHIIEKSKGNVSDILKITAELRSKFSCVREYINNYGKNSSTISFGVVNEIANKVFDTLKNGPTYPSKKIFENTYAQTIGVGPFTASSPVPDTQTINRLNKLNVCVEAFTEVIDSMIENNNDNYTKKLINNCGVG